MVVEKFIAVSVCMRKQYRDLAGRVILSMRPLCAKLHGFPARSFQSLACSSNILVWLKHFAEPQTFDVSLEKPKTQE